MSEDIPVVAELIRKSKSTVALTGAGISVDSGIPDFRSPGGLWEKFNPMEYATIYAFHHNPIKVWMMLAEMEGIVRNAKPNAGHNGLAELERMGLLDAVITQNIDNLHQEAGNRRVVEFHGNSRRLVCLSCGRYFDAHDFQIKSVEDENFPPRCNGCDEILKPDVILFGEQIPFQAAHDSHALVSTCTLMLVIGTSAEVYPAAELPALAKGRGAKIVEINKERTRISRSVADFAITGNATQILPALVNAVKNTR